MKRIVFFGLFLATTTFSFAQDISVKYSKGSSILNFDIESRSLLASDFGLMYSKNKSAFEVGFIRQQLLSDAPINNANDIYLNYQSNLESNYLSFYHNIGYIDNLKINAGLTAGITNFEIFTNLSNNLGQNYQDYDFENWEELGYSSENNFETNLSDLNVDNLTEYPLRYFYFGPLLECEVELIENFDLTFKSIYRKNLTDLLDNVSINNLRDIPATNQTDNQMDLFVGVRFNLSNNSKAVDDSIVKVLDSLNTSDDKVTTEVISKAVVVAEPIKPQTSTENIISREEYILQFFESSTVESSADDYDANKDEFEEGEKYPYVSSDFVENVIVEEEAFSLNTPEESIVDLEENIIFEEATKEEVIEQIDAEEYIIEESSVEEVIEENTSEDSVEESTTEEEIVASAEEEYYLIVGVFANPNNLVSYAKTLQISPENTFKKNNLNYLYIFKTNNLFEARMLRDSLEIENWIYYAK